MTQETTLRLCAFASLRFLLSDEEGVRVINHSVGGSFTVYLHTKHNYPLVSKWGWPGRGP